MIKAFYTLIFIFISNIAFANEILTITHTTPGNLVNELNLAVTNEDDLTNYSQLVIDGGILNLEDCKLINDKLKHIEFIDFRQTSFVDDIIPYDEFDGVGSGTFSQMAAMTQVEFPDNLKVIGAYTFSHCAGLKEVGFGANSQLERIGAYAFAEATSLVVLDFLPNLHFIDEYAFYQCLGIKTIYLPLSLIKISDYAFSNCTALEDVYAPWEIPISIEDNAFIGAGTIWGDLKSINLHVSNGLEDIYQEHNVWGQLNIRDNIPTSVDQIEKFNNSLHYDYTSGRLTVNTENEKYLKILRLDGANISTLPIAPTSNNIDLAFLPKGVYIIQVGTQALKIAKKH